MAVRVADHRAVYLVDPAAGVGGSLRSQGAVARCAARLVTPASARSWLRSLAILDPPSPTSDRRAFAAGDRKPWQGTTSRQTAATRSAISSSSGRAGRAGPLSLRSGGLRRRRPRNALARRLLSLINADGGGTVRAPAAVIGARDRSRLSPGPQASLLACREAGQPESDGYPADRSVNGTRSPGGTPIPHARFQDCVALLEEFHCLAHCARGTADVPRPLRDHARLLCRGCGRRWGDRQVTVGIDQYLGIEGKQSQSQQLRYYAGSQHDVTPRMLPARSAHAGGAQSDRERPCLR